MFNLGNYGNGFTHSEVYSMPVYLRKFYIKQLVDVKKKENEAVSKSNSKNTDPRIRKK